MKEVVFDSVSVAAQYSYTPLEGSGLRLLNERNVGNWIQELSTLPRIQRGRVMNRGSLRKKACGSCSDYSLGLREAQKCGQGEDIQM